MPSTSERAAVAPPGAGQHIKPSHFWSTSFAPPSHYWNHSQSHSLLDIERLAISDGPRPRYASLPHPPKPPPTDAHPARTLERASKSSSLKRLCGKGVTRMGSYLETLHRSARLVGIAETAGDADGDDAGGAAATPAERSMATRLTGRRPPVRSPVGDLFTGAALEGPAQPLPHSTTRADHGSTGISSDGSDSSSGGAGPSPAPSSHIYIDMPPRSRKTAGWNCASGSDPDDDDDVTNGAPHCRAGRAGSLPAPCACRTGVGAQPDPWDHRAIEYVMVPKSQYLSLYRANRLLRDACCCQGLGKASKLCDNCRQPTVILRSPSPAVSLPATRGPGLYSPTGSLQTRTRPAALPVETAHRAHTLLPRLKRGQSPGRKTSPRRMTRFSSQELLLDYASQAQHLRSTNQTSPARLLGTGEGGNGGGNGGSRGTGVAATLRRGAARLDYTDSWRSLSQTTDSAASSSGGSR